MNSRSQQSRHAFARMPRTCLGFNGHPHESLSGWQALGNGHRIYSPVLMRFHSPDALSPFERGGINAYAYCGSEPVNRDDPSGRFFLFQYKFKMMAVAAMFTGLTGATASAGVAVSTKDDVQRVLAIVGTVAALTVVGLGGRYAWIKRRPRPVSTSKTTAEPAAPRPTTAVDAAPEISVPVTRSPRGSASRTTETASARAESPGTARGNSPSAVKDAGKNGRRGVLGRNPPTAQARTIKRGSVSNAYRKHSFIYLG